MKQRLVPLVILFVAAGLLHAQEDVTVGELAPGDERTVPGGNVYIDWYSLPVTEASRLRVEVSSDDFLPYLILELPGGERYTHDGDYGVVPRLSVIVRQAGIARVGIRAYYADDTGEYEVLVSQIASEAVSIGTTIRAQLERSEALFAVQGRPGEVIDVRLTPDGFLADLRITDPDGWDTRSSTRDRPTPLNYIFGDSGLALISVHTYSSGGSYVLEVARPEIPYETPPDGFRLEGGERVAGVITSDSPSYYGSHYQRFTFLAEAGERIDITLESNSFEPHLRMVDPQGYEIALRSRIVATILSSGLHEIYAGPPTIEAFFMRPRIPLTGVYTMAFNRLPESQVVLSTAGFLAGIDERDADGYEKDRLQFRLVAGEPATIDVTSGAFDIEIILQDESGSDIAQDNDGGEGSNSRIVFTPSQTGTYRLEIFAHSSRAYGEYQVEVVQ